MQSEFKKEKAKERRLCEIEAEPCLYCGNPTQCRDYIVNPGAEHELPSCSVECFGKAKEFVDYDRHRRMVFYSALFALVLANLFLLGFKTISRWGYLPMLGIGIATCMYPLVFTRYERYQKFGIRKTKAIIRAVAALIAVFALVLIISY